MESLFCYCLNQFCCGFVIRSTKICFKDKIGSVCASEEVTLMLLLLLKMFLLFVLLLFVVHTLFGLRQEHLTKEELIVFLFWCCFS